MKRFAWGAYEFYKGLCHPYHISCVALGAKAESLTDYIKFYNS
jgi:hypothetical protein